MKLFTMRYRDKFNVKSGWIRASTLEKAEELGRKWCESRMGVKYLSIEDAVLAEEEVVKVDGPKYQQSQKAG